jgi:flagella basal body P-ring formation protein FlgA
MRKAATLGLLLGVWALVLMPATAAPLRERDVVEYVAEQAALRYQAKRSDVKVTWEGPRLATLAGGTIEASEVTLHLDKETRLGGKSAVPLQLLKDGKRLRTLFPRLEVQVLREVMVVVNPVARGGTVSEGDVELTKRALHTIPGTPILGGPEVLRGAVAKRYVSKGSVLVEGAFDLPPVVRSGSMVAVKLVSGGLTIIASGQAVSDGAMGQLVRVMNLDTRKDFVARVVGENRVEVHLEEER